MISNLGGVYQYGQDDPATLTKMILFHLPMKSPSSYNHPRFSVQTEVLAGIHLTHVTFFSEVPVKNCSPKSVHIPTQVSKLSLV